MKDRLTPDDIEALINKVEFFNPQGSTLTICILTLTNGCEVVGTSNVINPANNNVLMDKEAARANAKYKIWELEGYALKRDLNKAQ